MTDARQRAVDFAARFGLDVGDESAVKLAIGRRPNAPVIEALRLLWLDFGEPGTKSGQVWVHGKRRVALETHSPQRELAERAGNIYQRLAPTLRIRRGSKRR